MSDDTIALLHRSGSNLTVQGDGEGGRVPGDPVRAVVLRIGQKDRPARDEKIARSNSFLYFLSKGLASKKISLRTIRPSLNVIKAAARQTPIDSAKRIS
jgi:hypothetical protein